jgi:hypothetical protein
VREVGRRGDKVDDDVDVEACGAWPARGMGWFGRAPATAK